MKLDFKGQFEHNHQILIRKCGYGRIVDRRRGKASYMRRLGNQPYPRFHVYLVPIEDGFSLNLHLDQKKASYSGHTAHSGEYDGHLVENEAERIKKIILSFNTK